jgi:hypothetical protein
MRSLWKLFSVMTLSGALLLTGCGGKENETAADQPKLTPTQVIDKSMQTMEKGGHTYDVKTNQTITVASGDVSQAIKTRNTSTIDVTMNPVALHLKGKTESSGASEEIEMFLADNALYNKIPQMGWVKTTVDTSAMDASQDPMSGIKQVEQLFEKLGGNALPAGVSLNEEGNQYVLSIDFTALKQDGQTFESMMKDQVIRGLQSSGFDPSKLQNMKFEKLNQKIYIDKNNFKQTKTLQEMHILVTNDQDTFKLEQQMEMNLKGEYNGKIEVPADVKNSARQI